MCEFCTKHGEGEKWYLQAKNYSDDLLSDVRRRRFLEEFVSEPDALARDARHMDRLEKAPAFIKGMIRRIVTRRMKKVHFGQVVPIEEINQIFGFVNSIVRMACVCRHTTLGKEKRYCYGISLAPDGGMFAEILRGVGASFFSGPDGAGLETLTRDEAVSITSSDMSQKLRVSLFTRLTSLPVAWRSKKWKSWLYKALTAACCMSITTALSKVTEFFWRTKLNTQPATFSSVASTTSSTMTAGSPLMSTALMIKLETSGMTAFAADESVRNRITISTRLLYGRR